MQLMSANETLTSNFIRERQAPPPGKRCGTGSANFTVLHLHILESGAMSNLRPKIPCEADAMFKNRYACVAHFSDLYLGTPYYSAGRAWSDYAPAYAFGFDTYPRFQTRLFETVEAELRAAWAEAHGRSRLTWPEARSAVRETWQLLDAETAGQADRLQRGHGA